MINKVKEISLVLLSIFIFSYLLNFFWESFHSVYLYNGHNFNAAKYVSMIGYVSVIDGLLILGIYFGVSFLWKNLLWIGKTNKTKIIIFAVLGLIIATWIEFRGVFLLQRWSYNELMPTIFGIGLSPLIQLSITGIFALILTKKLIYNKWT